MNKGAKAFYNTLLGSASFIFSIFNSILLVPLFLKYWGPDMYSFWIILFAAFSIFQIFDAGHRNYISNEINIVYHSDKLRAKEILGSGLVVSLILSFIPILFTIILDASNFSYVLFGVSKEVLVENKLVFCLIILQLGNLLGGSTFAIINSTLYPIDKLLQSQVIGLLSEMCKFVFTILIILYMKDIFLACVSYAILSFFIGLFSIVYIKNIAPFFFPWWRLYNLKTGIRNFKMSIWLTVNSLLQQFTNQGIILLISASLSSSKVLQYSSLRTISNSSNKIGSIISSSLILDLIKYYQSSKESIVIGIISLYWFITTFFFSFGLIVFSPFFEDFFRVWTQGKIVFQSDLFYLLMISAMLINFGYILYHLLLGLNDIKSQNIINLSKSSVLLLFIFTSLKYIGLVSLGWAFLISELIGSVIIPLIILNKYLSKKNSITRSPAFIFSTFIILISTIYIVLFFLKNFNIYIYISFIALHLYTYYNFWLSIDEKFKKSILELLNKFLPSKIRLTY